MLIAFIALMPGWLTAEPVAVRLAEGSVHGFLALRTVEGKVLASGDLVQVTRGDRVSSRLTFRFKDGSVDDERTVFTQRRYFKLIHDRHIQKGPAFPHPIDVSIDVPAGQVTFRYREHGEEKVETDHLDLPPDLANGMILNVVKNVSKDVKETKISYLAATPKPRLVQLAISPQGDTRFKVAGEPHEAMLLNVKVELGGIAGLLAPLIGKQPAETKIWVAGGEAPTFVRFDGPLYLGAPVWSIQMSSPVW